MASISVEQAFELRGERGRVRTLLRDLWRSRQLVRMLARKDFYVRYRRASLGLIWAVGSPLVQATVLGIVLSKLVRFATEVPYPVFVFSGILPWSLFIGAIVSGTGSVVDGSALATKIYFPRPVLPLVTVLSGFYGLVPGLAILLILALVLGTHLGIAVLLLIPAVALLFLLASAFALVFGMIQVYARDLKHVVGAISLPWFWSSGVFYPLNRFGGLFRRMIEINPVVGVLSLFRASLGQTPPHWQRGLWFTFAWLVLLYACAAVLYRRYDRVCVDLL